MIQSLFFTLTPSPKSKTVKTTCTKPPSEDTITHLLHMTFIKIQRNQCHETQLNLMPFTLQMLPGQKFMQYPVWKTEVIKQHVTVKLQAEISTGFSTCISNTLSMVFWLNMMTFFLTFQSHLTTKLMNHYRGGDHDTHERPLTTAIQLEQHLLVPRSSQICE